MVVIMFAGNRTGKRSHIPIEAKPNKLEKNIGFIANLVWLLAMGYSIFLPFKTGTIWFYIGLFVFIIGLIIITVATCNFITVLSDQLITKGVYKLTRHPMYLSTILICFGSGISSGSLIFLCLSVILALCLHKEVLVEEKYCLDIYGETYQEYLNCVPRWIGIPKRIK